MELGFFLRAARDIRATNVLGIEVVDDWIEQTCRRAHESFVFREDWGARLIPGIRSVGVLLGCLGMNFTFPELLERVYLCAFHG